MLEHPPDWLPLTLWMRLESVTAEQLLQGERHGFRLPVCDAGPGGVLVSVPRAFDWLALLHIEGIRPRDPFLPASTATDPAGRQRSSTGPKETPAAEAV